MTPRKPPVRSVVLVVLDSARADSFGADTPVFTSLAEGGSLFERAVAPAGWTLPSHVSMFTGLAPTEHRAVALGLGKTNDRANGKRRVQELARAGQLITPRLAAHGIRTFSASANPWVGPIVGLDAGFEHTDFFQFLPGSPRAPARRFNYPQRLRWLQGTARAARRYAAWVRSGRDKGADRVLRSLEAFLSAGATEPFFAFTNLIETHEPHFPPPSERSSKWWNPRYAAEAGSLILQPGAIRALRVRQHNWGRHQLSRRVIEQWKRAYRDEIRYVDKWIGRLAELLEHAKRADDTVVIITGDHGESFGEGGIVGHGLSLRESAANVPLAVWGAGVATERVSAPVGVTDLCSTLEELLLDAGDDHSLLRSASRGRAGMEIEDPVLVSRPPQRARRSARGPGASFYDGRWKLVIDPFAGKRLYDLEMDPLEASDVSATKSPTGAQCKAMEEWQERVNATPRPA